MTASRRPVLVAGRGRALPRCRVAGKLHYPTGPPDVTRPGSRPHYASTWSDPHVCHWRTLSQSDELFALVMALGVSRRKNRSPSSVRHYGAESISDHTPSDRCRVDPCGRRAWAALFAPTSHPLRQQLADNAQNGRPMRVNAIITSQLGYEDLSSVEPRVHSTSSSSWRGRRGI